VKLVFKTASICDTKWV